MKKFALPLLVAAALGSMQAQAQAPLQGWYAGLGVGQATLDDPGIGFIDFDDQDTAYTARLGWRFHRNMAIELNYFRLGDYAFRTNVGGVSVGGEAKAKSLGVSFVGILPLDRFDLYGRVGYARSELEASASAGGFSASDKERENEWFAGVGGRWNFAPNMGLFAELQRNDKLEIDSYFVGLDFRF